MAVSSCRKLRVSRDARAVLVINEPSASSKALVCSDCVPPITGAMASMVVRITLL